MSDGVYDKFKEALVEKVKQTKIGDPMDKANVNLGPLAIKHLTE